MSTKTLNVFNVAVKIFKLVHCWPKYHDFRHTTAVGHLYPDVTYNIKQTCQ